MGAGDRQASILSILGASLLETSHPTRGSSERVGPVLSPRPRGLLDGRDQVCLL